MTWFLVNQDWTGFSFNPRTISDYLWLSVVLWTMASVRQANPDAYYVTMPTCDKDTKGDRSFKPIKSTRTQTITPVSHRRVTVVGLFMFLPFGADLRVDSDRQRAQKQWHPSRNKILRVIPGMLSCSIHEQVLKGQEAVECGRQDTSGVPAFSPSSKLIVEGRLHVRRLLLQGSD